MKSPTLGKVDELARMLDVHPLTLLALSYAGSPSEVDLHRVLGLVAQQVAAIRGRAEQS